MFICTKFCGIVPLKLHMAAVADVLEIGSTTILSKNQVYSHQIMAKIIEIVHWICANVRLNGIWWIFYRLNEEIGPTMNDVDFIPEIMQHSAVHLVVSYWCVTSRFFFQFGAVAVRTKQITTNALLVYLCFVCCDCVLVCVWRVYSPFTIGRL